MRTGTAAYVTGQETAQRILDAARSLFIEEGHRNMAMRRIADAAGMSLGNLSHYYSSKEGLLKHLLQYVIDGYIWQFKVLRTRAASAPGKQFRSLVSYVYNDLARRETTLFSPELWVLTNRDA